MYRCVFARGVFSRILCDAVSAVCGAYIVSMHTCAGDFPSRALIAALAGDYKYVFAR